MHCLNAVKKVKFVPINMKRICVFCASGKEYIDPFSEGVDYLVNYCKKLQLEVVYGGANVGLMGYLADCCIQKGVPITGIITTQIAKHELQHEQVTDMHVSANMHTRKMHMYEISDAFIVLPGSIGTLDEFFEVLCWSKLHIHSKPIAIYNINNYYGTLLQFIDEKVDQKLMDRDIRDYFIVEENIDRLFEKALSWQRPIHSNLQKEHLKRNKQ